MNRIALSALAGVLLAVLVVGGVAWWETKDAPPWKGPARILSEEDNRIGGWAFRDCTEPRSEKLELGSASAGVRFRWLVGDYKYCDWELTVHTGIIRVRFSDDTFFDFKPDSCPEKAATNKECAEAWNKRPRQFYSLTPRSDITFAVTPRR